MKTIEERIEKLEKRERRYGGVALILAVILVSGIFALSTALASCASKKAPIVSATEQATVGSAVPLPTEGPEESPAIATSPEAVLQDSIGEPPADTVPEVLRAKSLEIVDDNGELRAKLFSSDGETSFKIFDTQGQEKVNITVSDDFVGLGLNDGAKGVAFFVKPERASLGIVGLHDSMATISVETSGISVIGLNNGETNAEASIVVGPDGPDFSLVNAKGKTIFTAPRQTANSSRSPANANQKQKTVDPRYEIRAEPFELSGVGQQASRLFFLQQGLAIFTITHKQKGDGYFSIWLLNSKGENEELLCFNDDYDFTGSKAIGIKQSGKYILNVSAEGSWTVNVEQPR